MAETLTRPRPYLQPVAIPQAEIEEALRRAAKEARKQKAESPPRVEQRCPECYLPLGHEADCLPTVWQWGCA